MVIGNWWKVVFLSQVLPAAINLGYQQYSGLVLEKVNGKEIHDLSELAAVLDEVEEIGRAHV